MYCSHLLILILFNLLFNLCWQLKHLVSSEIRVALFSLPTDYALKISMMLQYLGIFYFLVVVSSSSMQNQAMGQS